MYHSHFQPFNHHLTERSTFRFALLCFALLVDLYWRNAFTLVQSFRQIIVLSLTNNFPWNVAQTIYGVNEDKQINKQTIKIISMSNSDNR